MIRSLPRKHGTVATVRWGAFVGVLPALKEGPTTVSLVRGGWLLVSPDFPSAKIGTMPKLRHRDGRGLWGVSSRADNSVELRAGLRIGPLMPGDHTFEVWIGAVKMGDVKATVVAGETRLLSIR